MEGKSNLQPYGDILTVTGKYTKDGKERNRYQKVGTLFATPHFSRISIKLDALPVGGDGWLNVFERNKDKETEQGSGYDSFKQQGERLRQKDDVVIDDGRDINLDDIPF